MNPHRNRVGLGNESERLFPLATYDRRPQLAPRERRALSELVEFWRAHDPPGKWPQASKMALSRLIRPLDDVLRTFEKNLYASRASWLRRHILEATSVYHEALWGWSREQWKAAVPQLGARVPGTTRQAVLLCAYLLGHQRDLHEEFRDFRSRNLADHVFGREQVNSAIARINAVLVPWGYLCHPHGTEIKAVCDVLLGSSSCRLEDVQPDVVARITRKDQRNANGARHVAKALAALKLIDPSVFSHHDASAPWLVRTRCHHPDLGPNWLEWAQRWYETSVVSEYTRRDTYRNVIKAGRWLAHSRPDIVTPADWTRETAAAWVAEVDRMRIGDWSDGPAGQRDRTGHPQTPYSKVHHIASLRRFFRDCQEWGWIRRRFDPLRALGSPRSIAALVGPDPRVIQSDVWAKLVWAGMNLTEADLARPYRGGRSEKRQPMYPLALVKAMAMIWLFAGCRLNEIRRLRRGCIRWQDTDGKGDSERSTNSVCLLDVPTNKTGTAYTKPIDGIVGLVIEEWEEERGRQPSLVDAKTSEHVEFLFTWRAQRVGTRYLNKVLVPMLCRKADVPGTDVRGRITSHRARSTIATLLYNAKEPMSLLDLKEWLGHASVQSTIHYTKVTPKRLAKAYSDAGYFKSTLRAIEVLIDRDAVENGGAASGEPWQHYDLGHGYCRYNFFEQCPHRMACARCTYYTPKASAEAQLLEQKRGMQRMLKEIPLLEAERAAVEGDSAAVTTLLKRLAGVPTPGGPPPDASAARDFHLTKTFPVSSLSQHR